MKINKDLSAEVDDEELLLQFMAPEYSQLKLSRLEAIKLRNYLNDYINGNLEEDGNEEL